MALHLLAHNQENFVREGDLVKQYKTPVAKIGKGYKNEYSAHLHYSISEGLTLAQLKSYVNGWTKKKVQEFYQKPTPDLERMFGKKMNLSNGWAWLQNYGKGFHPGIDVNDPRGGDSDLGVSYNSPCDGEVVFSGSWGKGWGNVVIINEKELIQVDCEAERLLNDDIIRKQAETIDGLKNEIKDLSGRLSATRSLLEQKEMECKNIQGSTASKRIKGGAWVAFGATIATLIAERLELPEEITVILLTALITQVTKYLNK